jgi:diacylglycerol kinase family enzyme
MDLISTYANGVSELTNFSQSLEKSPLIVDVIVNPRAGFFKRQSTLAKMIFELEEKLKELRRKFPRRRVEINTVHLTERPGHARMITEDILDKESRASSGIEHLLIGCGGDGTSNEICTALVHAPEALLEKLKLLRLPLGTGNDVADTPSFSEAYDLILGGQHTTKTGALSVSCGAHEPRYSFNIGSVGLDAYIVGLTNRFKRIIPGEAYKVMVDIGSLFYEQRVHPVPMNIRLFRGRKKTSIEGILPSMVVVGISGGRTYGGHMPVLPGDENVCIVDRMTMLAKVVKKKLFYEGRHGEIPQVSFHTADRVDIEYAGRIPMQLDGELVWLDAGDFPLSMRVIEPKIKILHR